MMWQKIDGFENYEVSSTGIVRSVPFSVRRGSGTFLKSGKNLQPGYDKDGYKQVHLYKNGKGHIRKVHRLVAIAFIPSIPSKDCVNHKNGNKKDNSVSNLEWVTKGENHEHAVRMRLKVSNGDKPVAQYTQTGELVAVYKSGIEAARRLGLSSGNISQAARGLKTVYRGFQWKYQ